MAAGLLTVKRQIDLLINSDDVFLIISVILSFFLLLLLGLGIYALYRVGWLFAGKELIEATPQTLTVTKQIFRWKKSTVYSAAKVSGMRTSTQSKSTLFPIKRAKRPFGGSGMIAFEYEKKTYTVGQEISAAEAKYIIEAFQEKLLQKNAS